jgi:hypothetical protein
MPDVSARISSSRFGQRIYWFFGREDHRAVAYLIPRSVLVLVNTTQAPAKLTRDQGNMTEEPLQLH